MTDFLYYFCTLSCLFSGLCGLMLFFFRKSLRRVLFWYVILCFSFCAHTFYAISPKIINGTTVDNFFLTTFAITIVSINFFADVFGPQSKSIFILIHKIVCILMVVVCSFLPQTNFPLVFILDILTFISYIIVTVRAIGMYKSQSKSYIYTIIAIIFINICTMASVALGKLVDPSYFRLRLHVMPFFLFLHYVTIALRYRESRTKTQILSQSLTSTIDKITHSENALMCTQMKPDFLYSTLDLISERCIDDPYTAEFLTISLSKYLRHTLNFQQLKGVVSLENEITLLRAYVAIESERDPSITVKYDISNPIPEIYIPPQSIQPLVENAIEHGFSDFEGKGRIKVTIAESENEYLIEVSDNGIGIPTDELINLPDSFTTTSRVGLYNIHTRLNKLFSTGLTIQSNPGEGTTVSFRITKDAQQKLKEAGLLENV